MKVYDELSVDGSFGGMSRRLRAVLLRSIVAALVVGALRASTADASLADVLGRLSVAQVAVPEVGLSVNQKLPDLLTPEFERLAVLGTDFPLPSTAPGFVYTYDPSLGAFTQSRSLGPAFTERAATVGAGRFDIGGAFLWGNLDSVNGGGLGTGTTLTATGLVTNEGQPVILRQDTTIDDFSLKSSQFNLTATYGINERWDVNILLPLIYNDLDVDATQSLALVAKVEGKRGLSPLTEPSRSPVSTSGDAFGAGDLLLRTKYRFLDGPVNLAAGLVVRFPSGNPNNFFGLGDYVVSPFVVVSRLVGLPDLFKFGPGLTDLHASLAVDANASNLDASRIRYTAGIAWQWDDRFALLTDFIGSSAFTEDEFSVSAAGGGASPYNGINLVNVAPAGNRINTTYAVQRTDILSWAMGLKVALPGSGTAFLGAILPMSDDGMRADVIPAGGVEFGF